MSPTTLPGGYLLEQDERIDPLAIINEVARGLKVSPADVVGDERIPKIVMARSTAMAVMRELTDLSYPAIGELFGRHHTTVMHHVESVKADPRRSRAVALVIEQLTGKPAEEVP